VRSGDWSDDAAAPLRSSRGRGPGEAGRAGQAWIIGKAEKKLNGCLYEDSCCEMLNSRCLSDRYLFVVV
jgi:hypothetical protein